MLWWSAAGRKIRSLDPDGPARTGLGRPFFRALGIPGGLHRTIASGCPHFHRTAGGNCPHAAWTISSLHFSRFLALVLRTRLVWDEAGRKLARVGKIFSP